MANRIFPAAIGGIIGLTATILMGPALRGQAPARGTGTIELVGSVRVVDGDTLDVDIDGKRVAVGLLGIRVPMANTECGRSAAVLLQSLVTGRIRVEEDLDHTFDARKRRMYYLKLESGASAAVELVRAGVAFPDGEGIEAEALKAAAAEAASARLGCAAVNPVR